MQWISLDVAEILYTPPTFLIVLLYFNVKALRSQGLKDY